MAEKPTLREWLRNGIEMSGSAETIEFCELLMGMAAWMVEEGEDEEAILEHMVAMADEFIDVAQAFKKAFGRETGCTCCVDSDCECCHECPVHGIKI